MPSLTVIAGPNAVGKTRSTPFLKSNNLIRVDPINIDLLDSQVYDRLPHSYSTAEYMFSKIRHEIFSELCEDAIKRNIDFAFETNLRNDQLGGIGLFDKAKYGIKLIYLLLNSVQQSFKRADYRNKHQGGIAIKEITIEQNFIEGLENLDNGIDSFDNILIIDNSKDDYGEKDKEAILEIVCEIEKGEIILASKDFPSEDLKKHLPNISKLVKNFNPDISNKKCKTKKSEPGKASDLKKTKFALSKNKSLIKR